jgi:hypothetical protein
MIQRPLLLLLIMMLTLSCFGQSERTHYHAAFKELHSMLKGEQEYSFKRAVFVTENAYVDNVLLYEDFTYQINALVKLAHSVAETDGLIYDKRDRAQVLLAGAIYRLLKDSLVFESPDKKIKFRNVPFTYDLDDFWGESDWTKMFVTKLLYEQTGNCHSLPALYKILADEVGVKAWLALAPNHTYIKQWSDQTGWYNTELTTGSFPYDKDIKWNSYIKSEAIAEGVYMDTLSRTETIAYTLTDLAQGYVKRFSYDSLETPLLWLDVALKSFPDYPNALILKAELLKKQYEQVMDAKKATGFKDLWSDARMKKSFSLLEKSYKHIDDLGYRRMPKEMYLNWLFRVKKDTTRTPYRFKAPQPFQQYNYKVLMVTAGEGENYEFFDQEEVTRIGSVELNRVTGKIVRFVPVQKEDLPDEIIGRMYDPALGRFWQVDPMAPKREWVNPYNFVQNNPVNRVDPSGLTDFTINKQTGDVAQVGAANDQPDRVLKTNRNGDIKRKGEGFLGFLVKQSNRGQAKVAFGGIQQGILTNGGNFQNHGNAIAVGGQGQPTVAGVRDFALKLSNYVDKEVGGHYLANSGENTTSTVFIGGYRNNDAQNERSPFDRPDLLNTMHLTTDFHTHLSRFGDNDRLRPSSIGPSGGDEGYKQRTLRTYPQLRFIIVTNPSETDQRASEIDY